MSGIAGFIDTTHGMTAEALTVTVDRMAERLAHRGPDDHSSLVDAKIGLAFGYRRLAVHDLSRNGRQPMTSANRRYVIVFNGQIHNFRELRKELRFSGERMWRGSSDTEVLLTAISRIGVAGTLDRCDGMFALAVWDRQSRRLHLARDRMGEKPLYYGWAGAHLIFASELKAFPEHPSWNARIDRDAVGAYFCFGHVPAPMSVFHDVHKLPAGHWLTLDLDKLTPGQLPPSRPYWSLQALAEHGAAEPFDGSMEDAVEAFHRLLARSVERCMAADVPLGALLSGSVDSSAVVALMQEVSEEPVKTFTIGFGKDRPNELSRAMTVAQQLGTEHTELFVDVETPLRTVDRLAQVFDEPFADPHQLRAVLLAELTREHVTAVLAGDGGDELFGGYPRYRVVAKAWQRQAQRSAYLRRTAGWFLRNLPFRGLNWLFPARGNGLSFGDRVQRSLAIAAADAPEQILARALSHWRYSTPPTPLFRGPYYAVSDHWPAIDEVRLRLPYADAVTYLPDGILARRDRTSMAVGLESRAPLLSREVVEFTMSLPADFRFPTSGEHVLSKLLGRYVSIERDRRSQVDADLPLADWLRGPLKEWAEDLLSPQRLAVDDMLRPEPVLAAWQQHSKGQRDRSGDLWTVLMFQAWRAEWP